MIATKSPRAIALAAALILAGWPTLAAQSKPCALLTSAEAVKHIARGQPTYGQTPDAVMVVGGAGSLCEYPFGGQVGIWRAPKAQENLEHFLKLWKADKATRHPVSGVGDRAWIMFPVPENQYKDRAAYLVAHVGQRIVTVALFARKGSADGPMGQVCRGDQSRLKPDEQEDCKKILANKSETQESLQPAVVELAKLVVEKVRAGKGS
jgi:hypothetical protein